MSKDGSRPRCQIHKGYLEKDEPFLVFDCEREDKSMFRATVCAKCAGAIFVLVARKIEEDGVDPSVFALTKEGKGPVEEVPLLVNPITRKPFKEN